MSTTRATLIQRAAARLGGHSGTLSFTAGVSTRAVLAGQAGTSSDDSMYKDWHLFMLDAATEADRERTVTSWQASTGTAGWEVARADTTSTSENYTLVPDYSLDEFRQALNKALRQSKRSYRSVIPITPGVKSYSLSSLTWLEGADDVDRVLVSRSPNTLHNEDFEFWQAGTSAAPDGWTLSGSGATVAQSSSGIRSPYGATVTRASSNATLYQDLPLGFVQYLTRSTSATLPVLSFGAWVTSSTASIARVGVYNGSATTWTAYHTGTGVPQFLSSTYQSTATDTALRLVCSVDTSAGSATFHATVLTALTTIPTMLRDFGSRAYEEYEPYVIQRNVGSLPVVEMPESHGFGQMVVTSRRPFPVMTADTDSVDDQYADMLEAGMLRWLLDAEKPNQDRARLERIRGEEASKWVRANKKVIDRPVQPPASRVVIVGI